MPNASAPRGAFAAVIPDTPVTTERLGLVPGLVHDGRVSLGIGDDPLVAAGDRLLVVEKTPRPRRRVGSPPGNS